LPADRRSTINRQDTGAQLAAIAVKRLRDLDGQLARGHEHQPDRLATPVGAQGSLEHRQCECRRLSGARRRLPEQVTSR
jgi:hypothetical protein